MGEHAGGDGHESARPDAPERFASVRFRPPGSAGDLVAGLRTHRLAAVVAPAGYGKTTLATSAVRAMADGGPAWVSLDPSDDDPGRFWQVLAHGLSRSPSTDLTSTRYVGTGDESDDTVRAARSWTAVRDLLSALETGSDTVLVLDDLHHLTDPTLVDQLRFGGGPRYRWRACDSTARCRGVDVTGSSAEIPQAHIFRFRDGRIVEAWGIRHELPALRELGVVDTGAAH